MARSLIFYAEYYFRKVALACNRIRLVCHLAVTLKATLLSKPKWGATSDPARIFDTVFTSLRMTHKNGASGNGMFVTTIVGITRRHKLNSEKMHY